MESEKGLYIDYYVCVLLRVLSICLFNPMLVYTACSYTISNRLSCSATQLSYALSHIIACTRDTVKLTVCVSIPAVTAQRLQN